MPTRCPYLLIPWTRHSPTKSEETTVTTLSGRPETALLVIDVQNDVVANAYNRDGVIANIALLVDKARAANVPVVWVQHSHDDMVEGSEGWKYVPELTQQATEPVVHKRYGDSFDDTDLEAVLAERKVGHVIIAGAETDACIRSTLHGAVVRGYESRQGHRAHEPLLAVPHCSGTPRRNGEHRLDQARRGRLTAPPSVERPVTTSSMTVADRACSLMSASQARVIKAFHNAQPRARAQVAASWPTRSWKAFRLSPESRVH